MGVVSNSGSGARQVMRWLPDKSGQPSRGFCVHRAGERNKTDPGPQEQRPAGPHADWIPLGQMSGEPRDTDMYFIFFSTVYCSLARLIADQQGLFYLGSRKQQTFIVIHSRKACMHKGFSLGAPK